MESTQPPADAEADTGQEVTPVVSAQPSIEPDPEYQVRSYKETLK
jgi:hypothetical protein